MLVCAVLRWWGSPPRPSGSGSTVWVPAGAVKRSRLRMSLSAAALVGSRISEASSIALS